MSPIKILVSRTDRAGDFILTLPVFREIKKAFPDSKITAHVRRYTAPIASMCSCIDEIICDDDYPSGILCKPLVKAFKDRNFDKAVIVHPTGRTILSAFAAGIPVRIGRASNVFQIFLNRPNIQKRSRNEKHEFEYNIDLIKEFVADPVYEAFNFLRDVPDFSERNCQNVESAKKILKSLGMENAHPVVIHPGHGGSAYNISPEQYGLIADKLRKAGIPVLISLGPGEEHMKKYFGESEFGHFDFLTSVPDMGVLACIFMSCRAFAGGSTGPLHLAAAAALPCVCFFPPVKAMTPNRWGPRGTKSVVFKPEMPDCLGKCKKCNRPDCMKTIDVEQASEELLSFCRLPLS